MVTICKLCQIVMLEKTTSIRSASSPLNILMDQTSRPLKIPPEYLHYAERHSLFEFFQVIYSLAFNNQYLI